MSVGRMKLVWVRALWPESSAASWPSTARLSSLLRLAVAIAVVASASSRLALAAAPQLEPPSPAVLAEARAIAEAMKLAERGPYSRVLWYCQDGSILPPLAYACVDHGGGRQHAEYSDPRIRLAELGWSVGTVFAALPWDELWDGERRHQRLRELVLERYLVDADDGWVLRRARNVRGRVQIEDEEAAGQKLLERLLSKPAWTAENFLLAREAVRALPHNGGSDRTRTIRRLALEIAERDRGFERTRIRIHSSPGPDDLVATRDWLKGAPARGIAPDLVALGDQLAAELERLYGSDREWQRSLERALTAWPDAAALAALRGIDAGGAPDPATRVARWAAALGAVRDRVSSSDRGAANIRLLDLSLELERRLQIDAFAALGSRASRGELVTLASTLLDAAYGCGLHSGRERDALAAPLLRLGSGGPVPTASYLEAVRGLRRAGPWSLSTVRSVFAEPLVRYIALEPKAGRFTDELLRGSPLLGLAETTTRLAFDADSVSGIAHRVFGETYGGLLGLNPGVATGRLRVVGDGQLADGLELGRDEIVVLPATVSELPPVGGILTLAEGNLLSHVQLLARNLGIPNAALSPVLASKLAERDGQRVLLVVGSDGSLFLETTAEVAPELLALLEAPSAALQATKLDAPKPDLAIRKPIALSGLEAGLAGRVVGPKAANLGELARLFPGRVEQAIALPFGVFDAHTATGPGSPRARLDEAFRRHRAGELDEAALAAEVEEVRKAVAGLSLSHELLAELGPMMVQVFGPPGSYGTFVRSDTNVEDLPGFTGAGLNETVPNVVDQEARMIAIARVWASPFQPRSMAWRSRILNRPEDIYTSVLIMKSVPADKSGVLVTADLATRGVGLTVATAWGVGGAVDGEAAETLVLRPDGAVELLSEAKAAYRRRLRSTGGVEWVPASSGTVLTGEEQAAVRQLAEEAQERLAPARGADGRLLPWDIEFGFVGGRLTLFQVRPLVERGQVLADRLAERLDPSPAQPAATIDLEAAPAAPTASEE